MKSKIFSKWFLKTVQSRLVDVLEVKFYHILVQKSTQVSCAGVGCRVCLYYYISQVKYFGSILYYIWARLMIGKSGLKKLNTVLSSDKVLRTKSQWIVFIQYLRKHEILNTNMLLDSPHAYHWQMSCQTVCPLDFFISWEHRSHRIDKYLTQANAKLYFKRLKRLNENERTRKNKRDKEQTR